MSEPTHSGFIAILGRPNVGKSTLLNRLLGQKISITSKKPQTTRHRIIGINTREDAQLIFVDTPGIHLGETKAINRYMNREAQSATSDMDVIIFMVTALQWTKEDEKALQVTQRANCPVILAVNKVDQVKDKDALLPYLKELSEKFEFAAVFPISAKHGRNVVELETHIAAQMPEGPLYYPAEQVTDKSERFLMSEIIREKLVRLLGDELPYSTTVDIQDFKAIKKVTHIYATVWVEREGQKRIIIGKGGEQLKEIGRAARVDMQKALDKKVYLNLWVKVKKGWSDDERALRSLGYEE